MVLCDQNGFIVGSVDVREGVLAGIGSALVARKQLTINDLQISHSSSVGQPNLYLILLIGGKGNSTDDLFAVEVNVEI